MTLGPLINPKNDKTLDLFVANPPHGLIISGPMGCGKTAIANILVRRINPLLKPVFVKPEENKMIGIDQVRELNSLMSRKSSGDLVTSVAIIAPADLMTEEAQNALLKTLEEPATGSMIILLARQVNTLLPTVMSRCKILKILPVSEVAASAHYEGYDPSEIKRAYILSRGYPEALTSILKNENENLTNGLNEAKNFLSASKFDRLCFAEDNKDRAGELVANLIIVTQAAIEQSPPANRLHKLIGIHKQARLAERQLAAKVNKKTVLSALALSL